MVVASTCGSQSSYEQGSSICIPQANNMPTCHRIECLARRSRSWELLDCDCFPARLQGERTRSLPWRVLFGKTSMSLGPAPKFHAACRSHQNTEIAKISRNNRAGAERNSATLRMCDLPMYVYPPTTVKSCVSLASLPENSQSYPMPSNRSEDQKIHFCKPLLR